jgi:nucleoside-diphosphate-sugar epimerase
MSKLVVYGGAGALGRALVQHFKSKGYVKYKLYLREKKKGNVTIIKKECITVMYSMAHYFYNYTIRP